MARSSILEFYLDAEGRNPTKEINTIRLIPKPYDAGAALKEAEMALRWSFLAKGPLNILYTQIIFGGNSEEAQRRAVDGWYAERNAEIERAEQAYRTKLSTAAKDGSLNQSDYLRALMELDSPLWNPFGRMRLEASERYTKERKFF